MESKANFASSLLLMSAKFRVPFFECIMLPLVKGLTEFRVYKLDRRQNNFDCFHMHVIDQKNLCQVYNGCIRFKLFQVKKELHSCRLAMFYGPN